MKQFVLVVHYGTGSMCMITDTPDILQAIEQFKNNYMKPIYCSCVFIVKLCERKLHFTELGRRKRYFELSVVYK